MQAARVARFDEAPSYDEFPAPVAGDGEALVEVRAAALVPLVKALAAGKHYSSDASLPFVPGIDGVGRLEDGRRVYFAFPRAPYGSMAEKTVVRDTHCVSVPEDVDDVTAAAIANPGMSSWAALTERAKFTRGESVLINGATGTSGRLAIQIARHLGADRVVATGRNPASLADLKSLGADAVIALDQDARALREAFRTELARGIDVVLDYLWGASAERFFEAVAGHASDEREPRIRFVQIGSIAGPSVSLPASTLRSSGLELMGSGLGSVPKERLVHAIGRVLSAVVPARLTVSTESVPLSRVHTAWTSDTSKRIVFVTGR